MVVAQQYTVKDAMSELMSDRKLLMETLYEVEGKDREVVPFILNPIQCDMYATRTGRDIYVKPSQVGATTFFIADYLTDVITIPGTTAVVISFDEFVAGRLLRKAYTIYNHLLERVPTIPQLGHGSTYEMTFPATNSSFYISSAGKFSMPRGEPIHKLLLDEFAFWPTDSPEKVFASAIQRVPLIEGTNIDILSTPNGEANDFYELYVAAKEGKQFGKSVYKHHFYRWFDHPEYQLDLQSTFALPGDNRELTNLTPDEVKLMSNWTLTQSQIRWRRYKVAEMESLRRNSDTRLLFGQEYPEDDVSCFISAGDQVYDAEVINQMAKDCYPAPIHKLYADIWVDREDGGIYLVAIDPGLGKTSESVATVWRFLDGEFIHCATLSGLYAGFEMATKSIELANYYNGAIIATENALDIVSHLANYHNLYYYTNPVDGRQDTKVIGWQTNTKTKPYMINELARHLTKIRTHDIRFVSQLRNIRWIQGKRGERAVSVGMDDYHDSAAIAIVCRQSAPVFRGVTEFAGWPENWGRRR